MTTIHQFVPSLVEHDAISTHVRHLQRILRDMGITSDIYAGEHRAGRNAAKFFRDFSSSGTEPDTWLMYHLSTGSPLAEFLLGRPEKLAIDYHNISPVEWFAPWEPTIGVELETARRQMRALASPAQAAVADSHFNAAELASVGYPSASVAPVLFNPADFEHALDMEVFDRLAQAKEKGGADWLFVGRVSPHKAQHDVIKAFAVYRQLYDANARLHIVGGSSSHHYWTVLNRYVAALQLTGAVDLTGGVSNSALGAYYAGADVFVCLSDHEGFGVPVLEAMYNRLPIVAYGAAAIPETVGGGGLLLDNKAPSTVAAAVDRVLRDPALLSSLVEAGTERLADFALSRTESTWRAKINDMVETHS